MDTANKEEGEDKLKSIINREFDKEIEKKEEELCQIQQRIYETKKTLDVLRYLAVTSYYSDKNKEAPHPSVKHLLGKIFKIPPFTQYFLSEEKVDGRKRKRRSSQHNVEGGKENSQDCREGSSQDYVESITQYHSEDCGEENDQGSAKEDSDCSIEGNVKGNGPSNTETTVGLNIEGNSDLSRDSRVEDGVEGSSSEQSDIDVDVDSTVDDIHSYARSDCLSYRARLRDLQRKRKRLEDGQKISGECKVPQYVAPAPKFETMGARGTNLQVKKQIVIGNLSKFLLPNESIGDKTTHKWMLYVRSKDDNEKLEKYVDKVVVNLHPSYKPNDTVHLHSAPFQLVKRGWGEFPVRVQMHFRNSKNKPIDVVHELRLDKTKVGLQTLGSETVIEIYIYE